MRVSHTSMAQVSWQRCLSRVCLCSLSRLLPSHVLPIFAVPAKSLRDHSWQPLHWRSYPHDLAVLSRPWSARHAPLRTCIAKFGYLAKSDANTGYEPKEFDKNTSVDDDATLINDPDHGASDFSKNQEREHWTIRCSHSVWILCFARFSRWFLLFREKAKKACDRETVARQREIREGFAISVAKSMSKNGSRNGISVSVKSLSKKSIRMDENIFNEELNKLFLRKFQIREDYFWMSTTWRSRIWNEEIQNAHYSSLAESLDLVDYNYWKIFIGQIKLMYSLTLVMKLWIHLWSRLKMKKHLHQECYGRSCREIEDLKRCWCGKEITKNNEDWKNCLRNMIRNHEQWVYSSRIPTYLAVMTYLRSSSNSYDLEFKKAEPRSRNAAIYTRGYEYFYVFNCQLATRDHEERHNDPRNLAASSGILRKEGIESSGSEEPLQSIPLPCFSLRAKRKSQDDK